ncbi:response regulator transcription factor [Flavobacterium salmonis]|uniref:Hybrid sensor histidine kinase/response regulator n=1 Tax=Flavobacterium salmonis TaxID=2654844 RepID=A0A6V6Z4Q8_9FLAO|nr:response regulator transcription factor [Flavobacterium salmonis]CAD0006625.1 hybrid sensor histidine kinase/response regulator [Flavobacterium salmonis]
MIKQTTKITLIEDDIALGNTISELLKLNNFEVIYFKDSTEGLIYLNKNIPDIIICDMVMPNLNGEELFFKTRRNNNFNTIPFIMITANVDDDLKFKQLKNGVNDFIVKPFKVQELIYKINNLISLKNNIEKKFSPDPFSKITIKLSEKDFITSLNEILIQKIKSNIDMNELSRDLAVSKSTLDKKIRKLTNKNASQYIREFRLDYAVKLINCGERNIKYIVDETGFGSFSYFSTSFKLYLNMTPRDFIKSIERENN